MLATVLMAFLVLAAVVAAMAIGAMVHGRTIAGSCGGIGNLPGFEHAGCRCKTPCAKRRAALAARADDEGQPLRFERRR